LGRPFSHGRKSRDPTLNAEYNRLLKKWAYEECGADLTGEDVYETDYAWVCYDCCEDENGSDYIMSDYEERMAERRMMGLSNF
jgi:hypothetical protein